MLSVALAPAVSFAKVMSCFSGALWSTRTSVIGVPATFEALVTSMLYVPSATLAKVNVPSAAAVVLATCSPCAFFKITVAPSALSAVSSVLS